MKILITENQYRILLESQYVDSKSLADKLVSNGIPKNKINLLKSGHEDSWVLQVTTEKGDTIAIQYPVLVDELQSNDKTKVDIIIDNKTKTMSYTLAPDVVSSEYKKRKLPTSRKN